MHDAVSRMRLFDRRTCMAVVLRRLSGERDGECYGEFYAEPATTTTSRQGSQHCKQMPLARKELHAPDGSWTQDNQLSQHWWQVSTAVPPGRPRIEYFCDHFLAKFLNRERISKKYNIHDRTGDWWASLFAQNREEPVHLPVQKPKIESWPTLFADVTLVAVGMNCSYWIPI